MDDLTPGLVSVMMPAHNAAGYVGAAIESVLKQTYADWEMVAVDDGSTDTTARIIAGQRDARIRVLSQPGQGESVARNTALDNLGGEYIAFLDADDAWLPDHLKVTVDYLQAHPRAGGVYADGYYIDDAGRRLATLSSRRRGPFEGDLFEALVRASDVFGPPGCIVLRREPIRRRQLRFDPAIVIGPDWDFLTAYAETETFGYLRQATLLYRLHDTSVSRRTASTERRLSLARCREKAIQGERFRTCTETTRAFAFYDLLVELLAGETARREAVLRLPEFEQLPRPEKARLFRLMGVEDLRRGTGEGRAGEWFVQAKHLDPGNLRNAVLAAAFTVSPEACRLLLRLSQAVRRPSTRLPSFETPVREAPARGRDGIC